MKPLETLCVFALLAGLFAGVMEMVGGPAWLQWPIVVLWVMLSSPRRGETEIRERPYLVGRSAARARGA